MGECLLRNLVILPKNAVYSHTDNGTFIDLHPGIHLLALCAHLGFELLFHDPILPGNDTILEG